MKLIKYETSVESLYNKDFWNKFDANIEKLYAKFYEDLKNEYVLNWNKLHGKTKNKYFFNDINLYFIWLNNLREDEYEQHQRYLFHKKGTKINIYNTQAYNAVLDYVNKKNSFGVDNENFSLYDYMDYIVEKTTDSFQHNKHTNVGLLRTTNKSYYMIASEDNFNALLEENGKVLRNLNTDEYFILTFTKSPEKITYHMIIYKPTL